MTWLDHWIGLCLIPLGLWLLVSGLDDLFVDAVWLAAQAWRRLRGVDGQCAPPDPVRLASLPRKRIAVWLPLWREHRVIGRMLERNLAACQYRPFDLFAGCYPNDEATLEAVREVAARHPNVHIVLCPHDGPTSKADCLNWVYQHMLAFERERGVHFDIIVTHDAEDWMHPLELDWINYYSQDYDMVQIPVLPLPTPARCFTHGVYCDEFAEYQSKDIPVRVQLRAALPGNGVGTGFTRQAIEKLVAGNRGRVFDPNALTEDYASGLCLHALGCAQFFTGLRRVDGSLVATREYFPQSLRAAVRQRKRWVTGIALQGWEQFGWRGKPAEVYFLWRDRKGLLGNPLSLLVNLVFAYGLATWLASLARREPWGLGEAGQLRWLFAATLAMQAWRTALRCGLVARVYGWSSAAWAPLRIVWANGINAIATFQALYEYASARLGLRTLVWHKTEHRYPSRASGAENRPRLGELLVEKGWLRREELSRALASKPPHLRLGEYLVRVQVLDERRVYAALSAQQNLPLENLRPEQIPPAVARSLPASLVERWKVLPFRVASGNLFVASPEIPTETLEREIRQYTRLEIRFHLVTPGDFERLAAALLTEPGSAPPR
ncbi:MAG: glycosyl transferase family protein [Bryobacteraceae bacterium]